MDVSHSDSDGELHLPADDIDYKSIAVGDTRCHSMAHFSPGYDIFSVSIHRPARHEYVVRVECLTPERYKRGGSPPDGGVTYATTKFLGSASEVHKYLRKQVPYTSFHIDESEDECERPPPRPAAAAQQRSQPGPASVELPTALLRFSASRGAWVEVAAAVQPRLVNAAKKWQLEVAGAPEPNNVPVSFNTFTFEEGALRLTFEAAGSTWVLRFGSEAAYRRFRDQIFAQCKLEYKSL